jgi:Na+-driven multidrug efflux pump
MFIFAPQILGFFFDDQHIIDIGVELLRIWSCGLPFISVWIMAECIFHGAGDNIPPMIVSLVASWIVEIPLVLLVIYGFGLNETAVWWARFSYFVFGAALAFFWLQRGKWVEKKV